MKLWNSQAGSPCACPVVGHRHCSSPCVSGALWEAFGRVKLPFAGPSSSICAFVFSLPADEAQVLGKVIAERQLQMQKAPELCEDGVEEGQGSKWDRV